MNRRLFLSALGATWVAGSRLVNAGDESSVEENVNAKIEKLALSDSEWRERLTPEQYKILRKEGTEHAGSSPLDKEYGKGVYHCAGCDLPLFDSEAKYDSGTGWPSFFQPIDYAHIGTKTDFKLILPRTEYHCARCDGHQGHVFNDGPAPTGKRYCNNGLALTFKPAET